MQNIKKSKAKFQKGQSLFEAVIALTISSLIIVAVVSLVASSIRNASFSRNITLASRYAQEATEWLRGQRDSDISTFINNTLISTWCLNKLEWAQSGPCGNNDFIEGTNFSRQVSFSLNRINSKDVIQADIKVFWNDSQGYHEARSVTNFTDWRQR